MLEEILPLNIIRQTEMEVVRDIAEAEAAAELSLLHTKSKIETLRSTLHTQGEDLGQVLYDGLIAQAETRAAELLAEAEQQAAALRAQSESQIEATATLALNIVLGRD